MYILPQYYAKLTQPIKYKESHIFCNICPHANNIVCAGFAYVRIFLQLLLLLNKVLAH